MFDSEGIIVKTRQEYMDRQKEIDRLAAQIRALKEQELTDNHSKILPFLQENCVFQYESLVCLRGSLSKDKYEELCKLAGFDEEDYDNHGCTFSKNVELCLGGSDIVIILTGSSAPESRRERFLREIKEMNLKVHFDLMKERVSGFVKLKQKELQELESLENSITTSSVSIFANE
jgi:hypothetical protein